MSAAKAASRAAILSHLVGAPLCISFESNRIQIPLQIFWHQFPSELVALAYSKQGQALLEGFSFFKIQNAGMMPDRVPLLGLQLVDKQQLVSFFKERGLRKGP
jgi:hypothetical protein